MDLATRQEELNCERDLLTSARHGLLRQIVKLKADKSEIIISEHALLRYLERVRGIDMDEIRDAILPPALRVHPVMPKACTMPVEGHKCKVRNGVVVTVIAEAKR